MRRAGLLAVLATLGPASPAWAQDAVTAPGAVEAGAAQPTPAIPGGERDRDGWGGAGHPMVGYAPESRLLLGAGMALYSSSRPDDPGQRLDEYGLNASYTTRRQGTLTVNGIKYLHGNDRFVSSSAQLAHTPSTFFGIGPRTPDSAREDYTRTGAEAEVALQTMVAPGLYVGPDYGFTRSSITDVAEGSQLASGAIRGSGTSVTSGLGLLATYDSTNPGMYKLGGTRVQVGGRVYHASLGSSYGFGTVVIDARHYVPLARRTVLALQVRVSASFGHVPFYSLASLGGDKLMRGYSSERHVGRHGLAGQAELRYPLVWRFGGVAFVGASEVEDRLADLGTTVRMAGGLGLRFAINRSQTINMRLDVSCNSDGQFEKYLKLREAF